MMSSGGEDPSRRGPSRLAEAESRTRTPVRSNKGRVTVGMPVYNGERYIREAIDSILSQTYDDFELIISDNASTDRTEEICRDYVRRDPRLRYRRNPVNRGAAWNHNCLVGAATGSFFKWVSADDLYHPEYLVRCLAELEKDPAAVLAYPKTVLIDADGKAIRQYDPEWELRSDAPYERMRTVILRGGHWVNADAVSGVVRLEALRRTRLLPRYQGGDKRPLGELSLMGKFIEIPEYLLLRRIHGGASSQNNPQAARYDGRSVRWMTEFFKGSLLTTCLPSWSLLWDHLRTVWSSQLPFAQKLGLTGVVGRACRWHRTFLIEELRAAGPASFASFIFHNVRR
jgi:glycosyltransferase involved in cell wall biosynthesis